MRSKIENAFTTVRNFVEKSVKYRSPETRRFPAIIFCHINDINNIEYCFFSNLDFLG